jgi:AcrR family transcriptional regulator
MMLVLLADWTFDADISHTDLCGKQVGCEPRFSKLKKPPDRRLNSVTEQAPIAERIPMAERIMAAADRLFYRKGIRAVGVDTVAAEAGISKRSLYDTFPSKDALVAAYLRQRIQPLPASDQPAAAQVLALFDQLHVRFAKGDFRGCPFVNAVTELAEDCDTARAIALGYKEERRGHIASLLVQAGASSPDTLASQVALLFEGAIASMLVRQDPAVAIQARDAAAVLMRAGITSPMPAV